MGPISEVTARLDMAEPESKSNEQPAAKSGAVKCTHCGRETMFRTRRRGLWKQLICPIFGYYPWKCSHCNRTALLKKRGVHRRRHSKPAEK